jgi:hypothetical protein
MCISVPTRVATGRSRRLSARLPTPLKILVGGPILLAILAFGLLRERFGAAHRASHSAPS